MGEDGCDRFRWVFEDVQDVPPSTPPQTSGPQKCRRSPSIEVSSPSPALPVGVHAHQPVKPLLRAQHHASSSHRSSKTQRCSFDLSSSSPPTHHHTPSIECPQPPRVWPFDFYADEIDIGFKKCRLESNKHWPVERVFLDHFHVKFVRSTFYNHHRHWMGVSQSTQERYIGYGQTERGRWSTFLHQEIRGERRMGQT